MAAKKNHHKGHRTRQSVKQTKTTRETGGLSMISDPNRPLLSIGMIFKNEIRCLEKCLSALQPLRDAIPCELVMADTGSDDGSRAVAERYADVLFDFPWIDDFAAARNAVLDRCRGQWFLSVDCDEYLDPDIERLVTFLTGTEAGRYEMARITIRNYFHEDLDPSDSSDCALPRMLHMETGLRYTGRIHEHWQYTGSKAAEDSLALFHHDGYVTSAQTQKRARNIPLLERALSDEPDNIRLLTLCIQSSNSRALSRKYALQIVNVVKAQLVYTNVYFSVALRDAIKEGVTYDFVEIEEWIDLARSRFSDSPFTQIDVSYLAADYYRRQDKCERCLEEITRYWTGIARWPDVDRSPQFTAFGDFLALRESRKQEVRITEAACYAKLSRWEEAVQALEKLRLEENSVRDLNLSTVRTLLNLWREGNEDPAPLVNVLSRMKADTDLGRSMRILAAKDAEQVVKWLDTIEDWAQVPAEVLSHVHKLGRELPEGFYSSTKEILTAHAAALAALEDISPWLQGFDKETPGRVLWRYQLALAAISTANWEEKPSQTLCTLYGQCAERYINTFFAPAILTEDTISLLPAESRFGWYFAQAQNALHAGDLTGYTRWLRKGVTSVPAMKNMVEFLSNEIKKKAEEVTENRPSPELLALAEQVKVILAQFPADDPSVLALKQSEAYQKVAYLIEDHKGGF